MASWDVSTPPLDAVLFDMDGLLVDTEPLWTVAQLELAQRLGGTWTAQLKAGVAGTRLGTAVPLMLLGLGHQPHPELVEATQQQMLDRMVELYAGRVKPLPGAVELHGRLRAAGVPVALVSSSYRVLVRAVLERLDLTFDLVLAGDEVTHAKPHPEPYATACQELGAQPFSAVVLEDSLAGIASGEAAGCAVVAVPSLPLVDLEPGPRRLVVRSLADVDLTALRHLVAGSA